MGAVGDPTGVTVLAAAIAVEGSSSVAIYEADGLRLSRFGRAGQPDDIASAVSYLAKDEAAFITGQTISVNGGQLQT